MMLSYAWKRFPVSASKAERYGLVLLAVIVAIFLQQRMSAMTGGREHIGLVFLPVIGAAIWAGTGPALFATVTGLFGAWYFLLDPAGSFNLANPDDRYLIGYLCFIGLAITAMGAVLQHIRQKAARFQRRLQQSEETLRALLESSTQAVIAVGQDGCIAIANRASTEIFGYQSEEMLGQRVDLLAPAMVPQGHEVAGDGLFSRLSHAADGKLREVQARRKDGCLFPAEAALARADTPTGPLVVCFVSDITQRKELEEQVLHAARHDGLTGLPNRALIYELGEQVLSGMRRHHQHAAVLFLDLDRFKPINDTYGHHAGDQLLQQVATRLKSALRSSDVVGRLGGDEFVAILADVRAGDVTRAANYLMQHLSEPYQVQTIELHTSPSIGISLYPDNGEDIATLIRHADTAMYHAKSRGRRNWQFFNRKLQSRVQQALDLEQQLRASVIAHGFELAYQPIINMRTMQVDGVEALIRWPRANGRSMLPNEFLAAAEASGVITEIGRWVLQEALRQQRFWQDNGLPAMHIAINVSPVQFGSGNFQRLLRDMLAETDVDPSCIELEVTEDTLMKEAEASARTLASLKAMGLRIALDDFGTGYSSLDYLARFPLDRIKVDRSFVSQMDHDERALSIADTAIALGKKLGVETVAEGVESDAAMQMLRQRGCELGQGYLFSAPMSAASFAQWYAAREAQAVH